MTVDIQEIKRIEAEADCLKTKQDVDAAFDAMAEAITTRVGDDNPIVCCVMNGGLIASGHLLTRLAFPLEVDYLHATRYRESTDGSDLIWKAMPQKSLEGRTVLVIDDILDEGITLQEIMEHCRRQGAKEVLCAVLVDKIKPGRDINADFAGMKLEDRYLFGYGMDYRGYLRNAQGIFAVKGM